MRAVVDVNVLISAALSARDPSAEVLRGARDGAFELVVSELLIAELTGALAYPKFSKRIPTEKAVAFVSWVTDRGTLAEDPSTPLWFDHLTPATIICSPLPSAGARFSSLVTSTYLRLRDHLPILTPAAFLTKVHEDG